MRTLVREATIEDMEGIVALAYKALETTNYRHIPVHEPKFRKLVLMLMTSSQHQALVATREGDMVGVLLGVSDQIFFSTKKSATDILTFSSVSGAGRLLVKRFVEWAKARPDIYQIVLSVSSGSVDHKRVGGVYKRAGLKPAGGSFSWYRHEQSS